MACNSYLASAAAACLMAAWLGQAAAQPAGAGPRVAGTARHPARQPKARAAVPAAQGGAMPVDDWFSYGPPKEAEVEKEAPGVQIKAHDPHEDDIVVYGVRQKRDFEGAAPEPNLTSPQALDAAQPAFVPGIGNSCSYKYGCFDSSQPTLRSDIESLTGGN